MLVAEPGAHLGVQCACFAKLCPLAAASAAVILFQLVHYFEEGASGKALHEFGLDRQFIRQPFENPEG